MDSRHLQKAKSDSDSEFKIFIIHCRQHCKTRSLIFTDIGSGLNMKRRDLQRLLSFAQRGVIETLFITHRDRLARFGVDLLQRIFQDCSIRLIVLMEEEERTLQKELVTDMMVLIPSFSGRVYGLRAASLSRHNSPIIYALEDFGSSLESAVSLHHPNSRPRPALQQLHAQRFPASRGLLLVFPHPGVL